MDGAGWDLSESWQNFGLVVPADVTSKGSIFLDWGGRLNREWPLFALEAVIRARLGSRARWLCFQERRSWTEARMKTPIPERRRRSE